jgi:hypothetical protein
MTADQLAEYIYFLYAVIPPKYGMKMPDKIVSYSMLSEEHKEMLREIAFNIAEKLANTRIELMREALTRANDKIEAARTAKVKGKELVDEAQSNEPHFLENRYIDPGGMRLSFRKEEINESTKS